MFLTQISEKKKKKKKKTDYLNLSDVNSIKGNK